MVFLSRLNAEICEKCVAYPHRIPYWARVWTLNRFGLHVQESALDNQSAAKSPKQRGQSTDQLSLDRGFQRIIGFGRLFQMSCRLSSHLDRRLISLILCDNSVFALACNRD